MCLKFIGSEFPERSKDFYAVLSIDNSTVTIKMFCIVCLEAIAGLDENDSKILYSLCEIFSNKRYFLTEDTKWPLPVKPVNRLCVCQYITCIRCCYQVNHFFSVLNFLYGYEI